MYLHQYVFFCIIQILGSAMWSAVIKLWIRCDKRLVQKLQNRELFSNIELSFTWLLSDFSKNTSLRWLLKIFWYFSIWIHKNSIIGLFFQHFCQWFTEKPRLFCYYSSSSVIFLRIYIFIEDKYNISPFLS